MRDHVMRTNCDWQWKESQFQQIFSFYWIQKSRTTKKRETKKKTTRKHGAAAALLIFSTRIPYFIRAYLSRMNVAKCENFIFYFHLDHFNFLLNDSTSLIFAGPFRVHFTFHRRKLWRKMKHLTFFFSLQLLYIRESILCENVWYFAFVAAFLFFFFFTFFGSRFEHSNECGFSPVLRSKSEQSLWIEATKSSEVRNAIFDVKWILELNITLEKFGGLVFRPSVCVCMYVCLVDLSIIFYLKRKVFCFSSPFSHLTWCCIVL